MRKLTINGERASADYGDLVYIMEKLNEIIEKIKQ